MPYAFYKVLHIFGIAMMLVALGGVYVHALNSSDKKANAVRRLVLILHGIGSFLILLAGFGLLARLGDQMTGIPGWVWPKLAIWLVLSGVMAVPYRDKTLARLLLIATPFLVLAAAYFALFKPF
ncbi:MAG: hypothetical protein HKN37_12245 [Rhodothermales bacterium]|nr:hypothetical protein [Rhodothermales bacterium]